MTTANPPDEPGVRISLATIYNLLLEVQRQVAELGVHRQNDAEDIRDVRQEVREAKTALGQRLEALEEARWPLRQIAALGTVATVALAVLGITITLAVKTL